MAQRRAPAPPGRGFFIARKGDYNSFMLRRDENLNQILDSVYDGIYIVDRTRSITYWSKGAEKLTGFAGSEALGRRCTDFLMHIDREGRNLCDDRCITMATLADGQARESMLYVLHKEGFRLPVATRVVPVLGATGEVDGAAVIFGDVTSRFVQVKRLEAVQKILRRDPAAELDNRREIEISLHMRFDEMQRYSWPFGILFFDVDGLEEVVRAKGPEIGYRVLKMVAMTMLSGIRSSDVVGRWGEKVFIAIVSDVNEHHLNSVANRVRMLVEKSMLSEDGESFCSTVSIGATVARTGDTVYTLLKRAEDLMKQSALGGKNRVTIDAEV